MSSAPIAHATTPQEPSTLAGILSYLIPGLGQLYQGRYGKGVLFMVSLLGMFFLGQAMGRWQNVYLPDTRNQQGGGTLLSSLGQRWHYAGQFWIGAAAWPALWQFYKKPEPAPDPNNFWQNYQRAPGDDEINDFLRDSDKIPDLGWVYTVIAGMLNILVIYDAYAGPMFLPVKRSTNKENPTTEAESKKEAVA